MDKLFNFFNQGWVGAVIGILGVLIAIYTYKRTKIGPRLVYQLDSLKVIGKDGRTPEEITIYYKGIKVPRIIKTTIIIWNSGTKTIDGVNIVKNDPLRLEFSDEEEIIAATILKRTKEVNEFEITSSSEQRNVLNIDFEYLDPKDGVSIEILHTDVRRYPVFKGSIKGMPKGAINWGNKSTIGGNPFSEVLSRTLVNSFSTKIRGFYWFMFLIGIGLTAFSVIVPNYFEELAKKLTETDKAINQSIFGAFFFAGIIYSILPAIVIWTSRKRYPKLLNIEKPENEMDKDKTSQSQEVGK